MVSKHVRIPCIKSQNKDMGQCGILATTLRLITRYWRHSSAEKLAASTTLVHGIRIPGGSSCFLLNIFQRHPDSPYDLFNRSHDHSPPKSQNNLIWRNKCIASSNKCLTSSNKKLLGAPGIATRSKDAIRLEAIAIRSPPTPSDSLCLKRLIQGIAHVKGWLDG